MGDFIVINTTEYMHDSMRYSNDSWGRGGVKFELRDSIFPRSCLKHCLLTFNYSRWINQEREILISYRLSFFLCFFLSFFLPSLFLIHFSIFLPSFISSSFIYFFFFSLFGLFHRHLTVITYVQLLQCIME